MKYLINENLFNLIEEFKLRLLPLEDDYLRVSIANHRRYVEVNGPILNSKFEWICFIDKPIMVDNSKKLDIFSSQYIISDLESAVSLMEDDGYKCLVNFDESHKSDQKLNFDDFKQKCPNRILRIILYFYKT